MSMESAPYHDLFDYSPIIDRPPLRWPNGAHVAVWIVPNIEHADPRLPDGAIDVRTYAPQEYGNRVGVFRIMDVLDKHGVRGTVALNAAVCDLFPRIIEEVLKRNWEIMGHGYLSKPFTSLTPEEERDAVSRTVSIIERVTGHKPRGWLGSALVETAQTLKLLETAGIEYVCDWVNDDQPYRMKNGLYSIPYTVELNDRGAFANAGHAPAVFYDMIHDAFDRLYAEGETQGRVLCLALHPYLIGTPSRIGVLDRALDYIQSHDRVWFATGSEIIDWYQKSEGPTA
jgi:allantoinase